MASDWLQIKASPLQNGSSHEPQAQTPRKTFLTWPVNKNIIPSSEYLEAYPGLDAFKTEAMVQQTVETLPPHAVG